MKINNILLITFFIVLQCNDLKSQSENIINEYKNEIYHKIILHPINSQEILDTLLDYNERFYQSKELKRCYNNVKDGKCIEFFKKRGKQIIKKSGNYDYFRLIEYKDGYAIGKVYDFNNDSTLKQIVIFDNNNANETKYTLVRFHKNQNIYSFERYLNGKYNGLHEFFSDEGLPDLAYIYSNTYDYLYYDNYSQYYPNGNIRFFRIYDIKKDYLYYKSYRDDSSVKYEYALKNDFFISKVYDENGNLSEKYIKPKGKSRNATVEYYNNGHQIEKTEIFLKKDFNAEDYQIKRKEKKKKSISHI